MDNTKPHKTIEKLSKLKMIRLLQPAYSPVLSPNDFFLYGFVKNKLKGFTHQSPEEPFQSISEIIQGIEKSTWKNVYLNWKVEVIIYKKNKF